MKRSLLSLVSLLIFAPCCLVAQDLSGIWRGYFITESGDQYRYEVQIDHNSTALSGVTYSYLDRRFYGKATFTGNFSRSSQNALVQEIRTVEVRMSSSSTSCIQKCLLTYTRSGQEEFLEGTFTSIYEKTDSLRGYLRGDDCGGGSMYLRKVPTSDFYPEPFLRKRTVQVPNNNNNSSTTKTNTQKTNTPTNNSTAKNTEKKQVVTKKSDPVKKIDTAANRDIEVKINPSNKPAITMPAPLKTRENNLIQTITVNTEDVLVKLYDNGEIDDDTISVYLNNKLVLSKKRLTAAALEVKLKMDEENTDHELVMVAENLGKIPPNTSLMVVTSGDKRYEVRITSNEQKNAVVRFRYVKQR